MNPPNWLIGSSGENAVKNWFSQHNCSYIRVSDIIWDDSSEFQEAKKEYDEKCNQYFDRGWLKEEYRQFYDVRQAVSDTYDFLQYYRSRIQETHCFFNRKREEEKRVKEFMNRLRGMQRKLNDERMNYLKSLYRNDEEAGHHWGSHTAMMPDLLVRMPKLTFVEVKSNYSRLESRQKLFLTIAKRHGFDTKIARVSVRIKTNVSMTDY
jgi:hypothetical protein